MSNTYFTRGTISVHVEEGQSKVFLTPCAGYLSPDKQYAIAFPISPPEGEAVDAKLIGTSVHKQFRLEFEVKAKKPDISFWLAIAAQQNPIELRLNPDRKIVGFVSPAPLGYAHGC